MNEEKDFTEVLDEYLSHMHHRTEGVVGVQNLARLCHDLGYVDDTYFGQFEGASYGDLILFLEDNPGVVEAIVNWIGDNGSEEWQDNLESQLSESETEQ